MAVAERYEIVFDFSQYAGQTIYLRNIQDAGGGEWRSILLSRQARIILTEAVGVDEEYENTDKVMKFIVSNTPVSDASQVPSTLRNVPFPPASSGIDHHFRFHRSNGEWQINNVGFSDAANRILAKVPRGKVEIWELENSSGGWTHPIVSSLGKPFSQHVRS